MPEDSKRNPLTFIVAKWYGYILSATFLLYGGVKIVLSFLDRTYADMGASFLFLIVGVVLISTSFAFRDCKAWGWYGLLALNGLVAVGSIFQLKYSESIVLLVLSVGAMALLFAPSTKALVLKDR